MQAHRIIKACYVGLFAASLPLCSISAQSDDSVCLLDTLIVNGNRVSSIESSAPLQHLSAQEIERLGVTNVGDAMKHLSGVTVKDYGGIGGLKTVSIRGMGAQHTAVFYDGVAVGVGTHEELMQSCEVYREIYHSGVSRPTTSQGCSCSLVRATIFTVRHVCLHRREVSR